MIGVIYIYEVSLFFTSLYEPLIYDDIFRLLSRIPGKCTFMFSTKNWFLKFLTIGLGKHK